MHAEFAWPSHRTAAGSVDSSCVAKMSSLSRSTLSPRLHTRRSPIAHARVGNCWSYSRSRLQPPMVRLLNVTRQERALPSTTCADLRPADGDTCRTLRVLLPAPTNSAPCGLPAVSQCSASLAVNRAYHVPNLAEATKYVRLSV